MPLTDAEIQRIPLMGAEIQTMAAPPASPIAAEMKYQRGEEARACADVAQREGDRLLAHGLGHAQDEACAAMAWRIAALIRQRIERYEPF